MKLREGDLRTIIDALPLTEDDVRRIVRDEIGDE